ncbi:hypothetical protein [Pedobacter montanisoli]|uniref:Beta-lactamase-inhibitor-like PepSY-like domain-containing protein n=1 Tax=Pedobacter montanisoli TaxID=2923277 RepID=A0ABS9ZS27_9SPHI|nr:hypothetical protein [Pedobacter montanisoli]MCJ0741386.1 hypothetical protein [Pedobacter montanisoli]
MKAFLKTFVFLLLTLVFACKEKSLTFSKLDQFSKIDTIKRDGKTILFKTDCYIVYNYKDNLQNERTVDSFAYKNRAKDLANYTGYTIVMYKHSDKTDIDNLEINPKDFDNYTFDNDQIFTYLWGGGTWTGKMKFKGRETVEAQEMIRED